MKFNAPTNLFFFASLIIAVLGVLTAMGTLSLIPLASVWIMAIAYGVLAIGCLVKGA